MADFAHSLQRPHASSTNSTKKISNGNGFTAKNVYDDVFGGASKFGIPTFSSRVEDYSEIFTSYNSSRGSSIPFLDLPVVDETDFSVESSKFDYSEIFGGLDSVDYAVPFEELFVEPKSGDSSSEDVWTPAETGSLSEESTENPACSESNQAFSNSESDCAYDGVKQFNVSYHKTNQISKEDGISKTTHIAQLNAVPAYTFVVDENLPFQTANCDKELPAVVCDHNPNANITDWTTDGEHFWETTPPQPACRSDQKLQKDLDENGKPFLTVSEISLRTQPLEMPPPSRPPPKFAIKKGSYEFMTSDFKSSKKHVRHRAASDSSPPLFDVEVDSSSSAAASAAAMKEAMEKAQARLKSAKEMMERKKDGLQHRKKIGMKEDSKVNDRREGEFFHDAVRVIEEKSHIELERKENDLKGFDGEERQKGMEVSQVALELELKPSLLNVSKEPVDHQHPKQHRLTQKSQCDEVIGEWKAEEEFYELAKKETVGKVLVSPEHKKSENNSIPTTRVYEYEQYEKKAEKAASVQQEKIDGKSQAAKRVCELEEDTKRLNAAKEARHGAEDEEKIRAAQKIRDQEEIEVRLKEAHEIKEYEKKLEEVREQEEYEKKLKKAREQEKKEALEREEYDKKVKEIHDREELEKKLKEEHEREENAKKKKEALLREENERRQMEAFEREENEKKQKARERKENEKRQKEAREREENEKKQVALEREEHERRQNEAREKEENERRINEKKEKEARQREENERRQKEAHEREENEKRALESQERQENEKKLKLAAEEHERRLKEVREKEENERRQKAEHEKEEDEKRSKESHDREENERKLKLAAEENDRRLKEVHEREEIERTLEETHDQENPKKKLKNPCEEVTEELPQQENFDTVEKKKIVREPHGRTESEMKPEESCEWEVHDSTLQSTSDHDELKKRHNENFKREGYGQHEFSQVFHLPDEESKNQKGEMVFEEIAKCDIFLKTGNEACAQDDGGEQEGIYKQQKMGQEPLRNEDYGKTVKSAQFAFEHRDNVKNSKEDEVPREQDEMERLRASCMAQSSSAQEKCEDIQIAAPKVTVDGIEKKPEKSEDGMKREIVQLDSEDEKRNRPKLSDDFCTNQERKQKNLNGTVSREESGNGQVVKEREQEKERLRKLEDDRQRERERERERDRIAVEKVTREARERAFAEARERAERAAVERATAEARQRAMAEARERLEKACAEAREKSLAEKAYTEGRLRVERAAVERATTEARERAEKAMAERAAMGKRERVERSVSEKFSATSGNSGLRHNSSFTDFQDAQFQSSRPFSSSQRYPNSSNHGAFATERSQETEVESAQRCKARLERHQRTVERAAKALAEKNLRDHQAQREQSERNRLAETLDADVKRWSSGKEGNLRALLSTLQYILGPDSGWQPVPLTDVVTAIAVKKAYRKATLCVHPDKLQQRGASIQQKYICEKVFDLLKDAWNKYNSEER